jgi:DNA-directed RNA polymerase subunit M/transcription elongation factor TFIIS
MMKFCPNCNTLLYKNEQDQKLWEICRNCGFKRESKDDLVYLSTYTNVLTIPNVMNRYVIYDPTLPRTKLKQCPNEECESRGNPEIQEAVFFPETKTLYLKYVCCVCSTEWKYV